MTPKDERQLERFVLDVHARGQSGQHSSGVGPSRAGWRADFGLILLER
jgi:hypothetical protein